MVTYPYRAYIYKENKIVDVSYVSVMKNYFIEYHRREDYEVKHNMKEGSLMSNTFFCDDDKKQIYTKDYILFKGILYLVDYDFNKKAYSLLDSKGNPILTLKEAKASKSPLKIVGNFFSNKKDNLEA